jgi:hypothetical protein
MRRAPIQGSRFRAVRCCPGPDFVFRLCPGVQDLLGSSHFVSAIKVLEPIEASRDPPRPEEESQLLVVEPGAPEGR